MELWFEDGVRLDMQGPLRVQCVRDEWFVVGRGMLFPVETEAEAMHLLDYLSIEEEN